MFLLPPHRFQVLVVAALSTPKDLPFEPLRDTCLDDAQKLDRTINRTTFLETERQLKTKEPVIYQVCMSPGCVADGSLATFEQMIALAPPHTQVLPGVCHSLCGNGPVVEVPNEKRRLRRIKGAKINELLQTEGVNSDLVEGYQLVLKGDEAFAKHQYVDAVNIYEQAVRISFRPALDAQTEREKYTSSMSVKTRSISSSTPSPLDWLVRARRNTAISLLYLGNLESALLEAQAACNLARNQDWKCCQVVASIYQKKGDKGGELESLLSLFALPVDESRLDFVEKNDRRELQFRLQRLARDLNRSPH